MNTTFEKLWNEYFAEECAKINTEEEKVLLKKTAELHEKANELLTKEQIPMIEKYIETLYELQSFFGKKAFFKGCEFTISFFLETGIAGKIH